MRVLQVFNRYRQRGGEETVVELEAAMLRRHGHDVACLSASTSSLDHVSAFHLVGAGLSTVWSVRGYSQMRAALQSFNADIVHVHNTFPLLSPSVFWAADRAGVPLVLTLHNFRLACANACLVRDGKACLSCVGGFGWPALRYKCFHDSIAATAAVVAMNAFHRLLGTYRHKVHAYIALSSFSRNILVQAGLPAERVWVKPNCVPERDIDAPERSLDMLYVGEISRIKGVHLLLSTWHSMGLPGCRISLIGDGPDKRELQSMYAGNESIVWRGGLPHDQVLDAMAACRWLILPSLCFENFPMVLLEAWSVGTPVIASNHGPLPAIISPGENGFLFTPGDSRALGRTLMKAASIDDKAWNAMSSQARRKCRSDYAEKENHRQLMSIYRTAMDARNRSRLRRPEHVPNGNDPMLPAQTEKALQ
jgi:glycosyltransferase involved in cell wall biosynthesis